jgi:hypothetical protein
MGLVFEASDSSGRAVALKLVRGELAFDRTFRKRFERPGASAIHTWWRCSTRGSSRAFPT